MHLFREIGFRSATFLVIGNIVGVGIFTTSGLIAQEIGASWWLLGVWILGGIIALIGATCYSLLAAQMPRAGGEYAFLYPYYGELPAFLSGWASLLIGFSAPIAGGSLALTYYLGPFLPTAISAHPIRLKLMAMLFLLVVCFLLSLGLRFGSRVQTAVTLLNVTLILGFSLLVLRNTRGGSNLMASLSPGDGVEFLSLGSSVVLVMFAYSGWNAATYVAEEVRSPERNVPQALLTGTLVVTLIYLIVNVAYLSAVPLEALAGKIVVAEITASRAFGPAGPLLVNALISLSILSSLVAMSIAGPRVYFAMSRDQLFPQWLSEVHPKKKSPVKSLWFQSLVALGLIAAGSLYQILLYSGFVLTLFATLTVCVVFKLKRPGRARSELIVYRLAPALFVMINSVVLFSTIVSHPREAIAGLLTVAAGLPVYSYYGRRREISGTHAVER
ncbi:MAG: amino acid permease [Acidobacteria bacterium]|nr:amino acid permease [Acidobacteriota bacterium]